LSGKSQRREDEQKREDERERVRRDKMQVCKKVEKSRKTVFLFNDLWLWSVEK
jgi:uncharacterized membrane protein